MSDASGPALLAPIIAHRGASGDAPENTLAALSLAADHGASCAEIDVSISSDGIPYVHHDDKLDRCTTGQGLLCEHSAAELDLLDASKGMPDFAGEPLPRLSAVFDLLIARGLGLNLEIKPRKGLEEDTVEAICTLIEDRWPAHLPLVFSSFNWSSLGMAMTRLPRVPRALLVGPIPDNWQALVTEYGCRNIHCDGASLKPEQTRKLRQAGLGIYCYTVNDTTLAERLFDLEGDKRANAPRIGDSDTGVHGIFTDYPKRLSAHFEI